MKTLNHPLLAALLLLSLLALPATLAAQDDTPSPDYVTIKGLVRDAVSRHRLAGVDVCVAGTTIGTVTNDDGHFILKIERAAHYTEILLSHVGYTTSRVPLSGADMPKVNVDLTPQNVVLKDLIVSTGQPADILRAAIRKIPDNYGKIRSRLTGFYRETVQKRKPYVSISEAVIDFTKSAYTDRSTSFDRAEILKGRRLISQRASDTLAVKLLGGPNLSIYLDVVKNSEWILNETDMSYYHFDMEEPVYINRRLQYVISFRPDVAIDIALYKGKFYIDEETLTFTRAQISLDLSDEDKATAAMLRQRPNGLIFKPLEMSYTIGYRQHPDGTSYLGYVGNVVRFKCDWHRHLFSTTYTIHSEMVTTDAHSGKVSNIPLRQSFNDNDAFTDKVSTFLDVDFWGAYNIIEPTESLENAVKKLKKQRE
jgi:hypothetical protein